MLLFKISTDSFSHLEMNKVCHLLWRMINSTLIHVDIGKSQNTDLILSQWDFLRCCFESWRVSTYKVRFPDDRGFLTRGD